MRAPWPAFKRLRRDEHPETAQCWLHMPGGCLSIWNRNSEPNLETRNPFPTRPPSHR